MKLKLSLLGVILTLSSSTFAVDIQINGPSSGGVTVGANNTWTGINSFQDGSKFSILNQANNTKVIQFDASGITTGNTITIKAPDSNTTLPIISQIITISGPTAARTFTFPDSSFTVPTNTLNNLGTTSINASLIPSAPDTIALGSAANGYSALNLVGDATVNSVSIVAQSGRGSANTMTIPLVANATFAFINAAQTYTSDETFSADHLIMANSAAIAWEGSASAGKAYDYWNSTNQRIIGVDSSAEYAVIMKAGNEGFNWALTASTPTLFLTGNTQNTAHWGSFTYNDTDLAISTGLGGLDLTGLNSGLVKMSKYTIDNSAGTFKPVSTGVSDLGTSSLGFGNLYLHRITGLSGTGHPTVYIDDSGNVSNSRMAIGLGYLNSGNQPGEIGAKTFSTAGNTDVDVYISVRNATTNTAPSDAFIVDHTSEIRLLGGLPTVGTCGTGQGGAITAGSNSAGHLTAGTGALSSCVVNFSTTLTTTPECFCTNQSSASNPCSVTAVSTSSFTMSGTVLTSDVLSWICMAGT